jgi:hypothetical protein
MKTEQRKKRLSSEFVEEQPDEHQEKASCALRSVRFEEVDMDFDITINLNIIKYLGSTT